MQIYFDYWSQASADHPGTKEEIPPLAAARLQQWAVLLSTFNYNIKFNSTHDHGNVDGLSLLPIPKITQEGETLFNTAQLFTSELLK